MKLTYVLLLAIALAINVNAQGEEQAVPLTTAEEAASKSDEQKGADGCLYNKLHISTSILNNFNTYKV